MKTFGIIMAGGNGSRLWPLSRENNSKQTITDFGDKTLLEKTIDRVNGLFDEHCLYLSINHKHLERTQEIIKHYQTPLEIFSQPYNKNNAPFILFIALKIIKRYGNGVMCLLPSDHLIKDEVLFQKDLLVAMNDVIEKDRIVAIGTPPDYPSETYGYIQLDNRYDEEIKPVKAFKEKPSFEVAKGYLESGDYLWNAGVYVWTASKAVQCFQRFLPKVYHGLSPVIPYLDTEYEEAILKEAYHEVQDISIDHGIMEQTDELFAMKGHYNWIDVGNYEALVHLYGKDQDHNVIKGTHIGIDSNNNIILSEKAVVATIGLEDTVVSVADDVILLCKKKDTAQIKHLINLIKEDYPAFKHLL